MYFHRDVIDVCTIDVVNFIHIKKFRVPFPIIPFIVIVSIFFFILFILLILLIVFLILILLIVFLLLDENVFSQYPLFESVLFQHALRFVGETLISVGRPQPDQHHFFLSLLCQSLEILFVMTFGWPTISV
jgi:hypothetical protein